MSAKFYKFAMGNQLQCKYNHTLLIILKEEGEDIKIRDDLKKHTVVSAKMAEKS